MKYIYGYNSNCNIVHGFELKQDRVLNLDVRFQNYLESIRRGQKLKREKIACNCKNITYGMIEDAIINGASSYEEVEARLKFGTGCGQCKEFIHFLIRDILEEQGKGF